MARYFFDVKNGHRLIDPSGLDCASDEEAKRQAEIIAAQIAADLGARPIVRRIAVLNEERREVATVTIGAEGQRIRGVG